MAGPPIWAWLVFGGVLLLLLIIDLSVHRGGRANSRKASVVWSVIWIAAGLLFSLFVWRVLGGDAAQEYLAAYLIEKSLSLDNVFVFLLIFHGLHIPKEEQREVLSWGIFGALVFRAAFVFLGVAAIERYHWVVYVFGGILIWAAVRILREDPAEKKENQLVAWLSRHMPVTTKVHGRHFIAHENGRRVVTPLLIALVAIELTDITFAVDSVPAALAITHDEYVVYTSNAFAILGLRSLYLVLESTIGELKYLHYGLAVVLVFAGFKLISAEWVHIPPLISVAIIVVCIGVAVWASLRARKAEGGDQALSQP